MTKDLPFFITGTDALNSIGENIIIADKDFRIIWLNSKARESFTSIAPLFGLGTVDEIIGLSMDFFHERPAYQRQLVKSIEGGHRARINIKNTFVADIVITPIKGEKNEHVSGYMVMLMDVTTQAEEERRIKETIKDLSVPILQIWDHAIALPLVGNFDVERGDILIPAVLEECTSKQIRYVMVSLAGINHFDESVRQTLQKLHDSLRLLGVQCIVVGIKPKMAKSIVELNNILTFRDAHEGLKYILNKQL
ncbi:STAS domain-containing protein [Cytobacillus oceanisediminis]|uniref:STAS domain-containing protein n=1 Tax=Cytobacillus oceanisediminis TaxID=665099 RepID=UPI002495988F|nr:STAS domain-containing protein [Cytobacillus oceanisediminis]